MHFRRLIYESLSHTFFLPPLLQIAEGRGTTPCRLGFSEDVYKVVLPDIAEIGQPLFNGEYGIFPALFLWWILVMSVFD